jgi:chromosome segregation ATPase
MQIDSGISAGMLWAATGVMLTAVTVIGRLIATQIKSAVEVANSKQSEGFAEKLNAQSEDLRRTMDMRDEKLRSSLVSTGDLRAVDQHIGMVEKEVDNLQINLDRLYQYTHDNVHRINNMLAPLALAVERLQQVETRLEALRSAVDRLPH